MDPNTRRRLNSLKDFNLYYAAKTVCRMGPRHHAIAEAGGLGQAVEVRRTDKAAARAKAKAARASRKRNR